MDEVSGRMMQVAGCEVKCRGQPGYNEASTRAQCYICLQVDYLHTWTILVPKDEEGTTGPTNPSLVIGEDDDDDAGFVPVMVICCSAPSSYCRRLSEAQYQWLKQVMGKEPRWFLIDKEEYDSLACDVLWRKTSCCPKVRTTCSPAS